MITIAFVIPWCGKLPNTFPFWLETCKNNPTVDFLLFTDDHTQYNFPDNVKVHHNTFKDLQERFQRHFDFPIALNKPYKFCDFKPAFGEIFQDYLGSYDFWGHCDIDLFWGNIRKYVTDDILKRYNKIYNLGHCCLYKNTKEVNAWYRTLPEKGYQNWKRVFQNPESCCFDETGAHCGGGMAYICEANEIPVYFKVDYADLRAGCSYLSMSFPSYFKKNRQISIKVNRNGVYIIERGNPVREVLYVHYQKRKLKIKTTSMEEFYLVAPYYLLSSNNRRTVYVIEGKWYEFRYYLKKTKEFLKKRLKKNLRHRL